MSQETFAELAGAARRAMIKWEKNESTPLVTAVVAWAEAGADALYILTGRRTADRPDDAVSNIEDHIASIRQDMLVQTWEPHPGEDEADAEARVMKMRAEQLQTMLRSRVESLTTELAEELESLLAIITSPVQLAAFRAADHVQRRAKRKRMRETIGAWTNLGDYQPNEAVTALMTTIALDYSVPVSLLAELVYEIVASDDGGGARSGALAT